MGSKKHSKKKPKPSGVETPEPNNVPNNPVPQPAPVESPEPRRLSVEVETQTSHSVVRMLSLGAKDIPKPFNEQLAQKPAAEPIDTQTSHAAIRRLSQGAKDIPKPIITVQEPPEKFESFETQTPNPAVKRATKDQIEKKSADRGTYPVLLPVKTQTSQPNVKKRKNEGRPTAGINPRRKPHKKTAKPVRSLEEATINPRKVKSNNEIPVVGLDTPNVGEYLPRRRSEEVNRPPRKSQEVENPPRKSQEVDKPLRTSQEADKPPRKSQEVENPPRKSPEIDKSPRKSSEAQTKRAPRKSRKSLARKQSQFQYMEHETYVTPKKANDKPTRNIFRRLIDTVSSIFLGPKYSDDDSPANKIKPIPLKDAKPEVADLFGPTVPILDPQAKQTVGVKPEEEKVDKELSLILDFYKKESGRNKKERKDKSGKFSYEEIMTTLRKQGIPLPSDEDFARLQNSHGQRWDPNGTVLEYYSPVLRSFIPVNMRGRYRGCWSDDQCMKGLDISKLAPKPDALEGYVDRGRQYRIQAIYDAMETVALSEDHLDYMIEVLKTQVMILPIPIFYDVLNLGCDTLNWNIKILQSKEGIPPHNKIYSTTEERAVTMQKKLQVYAALGLEPLFAPRKGMGQIHPQWTKTRDELITSLIKKQNELEREKERIERAKPPKKEMESHTSMMPQEFDKTVSLGSVGQKPPMYR